MGLYGTRANPWAACGRIVILRNGKNPRAKRPLAQPALSPCVPSGAVINRIQYYDAGSMPIGRLVLAMEKLVGGGSRARGEPRDASGLDQASGQARHAGACAGRRSGCGVMAGALTAVRPVATGSRPANISDVFLCAACPLLGWT